MPLGRFFRRRDSEAPPPTDEAEVDATEPEAEAAESDESLDVEPEADADFEERERRWRARAADVIPGGTSTGSKRAAALYGEGNEVGPTHFVRASGCYVLTAMEERLIDCTMALGSVAIGYADESITRAVLAAAASGNVSGFAHISEVEIAERLCDVIPCAERVRFLKSGAEGVAAAVRIARAATGRDKVVGCGYFGWHDWANTGRGIPERVRAQFSAVPFDDVRTLERTCRDAGTDLAAVVLEPVIERMPSEEWVQAARRLCDELGAVLIFDELKTGFRLRPGGYHELTSLKPDVAVFGKAMANGFPVAAVVGDARVMAAAEETWISSTLAGESVALAAVGAVLDWHEQENVCEAIAVAGARMREALTNAIAASGATDVEVDGLDPMWMLRFGDAAMERRFLELAVREGVLFKRGAYNYPALAHREEEVLVEIERCASSAFVALLEETAA